MFVQLAITALQQRHPQHLALVVPSTQHLEGLLFQCARHVLGASIVLRLDYRIRQMFVPLVTTVVLAQQLHFQQD